MCSERRIRWGTRRSGTLHKNYLLGGQLKAGHNWLLDGVHVVHTLGAIHQDVGAVHVRAEAPDLPESMMSTWQTSSSSVHQKHDTRKLLYWPDRGGGCQGRGWGDNSQYPNPGLDIGGQMCRTISNINQGLQINFRIGCWWITLQRTYPIDRACHIRWYKHLKAKNKNYFLQISLISVWISLKFQINTKFNPPSLWWLSASCFYKLCWGRFYAIV